MLFKAFLLGDAERPKYTCTSPKIILHAHTLFVFRLNLSPPEVGSGFLEEPGLLSCIVFSNDALQSTKKYFSILLDVIDICEYRVVYYHSAPQDNQEESTCSLR
jgi:hypothetical protein